MSDFEPAIIQAADYYANRSRDPKSDYFGTWQTTHMAVYDIDEMKVHIIAQENDKEHEFGLEKESSISAGDNCEINGEVLNVYNQIGVGIDKRPKSKCGLQTYDTEAYSTFNYERRPDFGDVRYFKDAEGVVTTYDKNLQAIICEPPEEMKIKIFGLNAEKVIIPLGLSLTSLLDELPFVEEVESQEEAKYFARGDSHNRNEQGLILPLELFDQRLEGIKSAMNKTTLGDYIGLKFDSNSATIYIAESFGICVREDADTAYMLVMLLSAGVFELVESTDKADVVCEVGAVHGFMADNPVAVKIRETITKTYVFDGTTSKDITPKPGIVSYQQLCKKPKLNGMTLDGETDLFYIDLKEKPKINGVEIGGKMTNESAGISKKYTGEQIEVQDPDFPGLKNKVIVPKEDDVREIYDDYVKGTKVYLSFSERVSVEYMGTTNMTLVCAYKDGGGSLHNPEGYILIFVDTSGRIVSYYIDVRRSNILIRVYDTNKKADWRYILNKPKKELLWENDDPTQAISEREITLNDSVQKYDYCEIEFEYATDYLSDVASTISKAPTGPIGITLSQAGDIGDFLLRSVKIDANGTTANIRKCYIHNTDGTTNELATHLIPTKIYGINGWTN